MRISLITGITGQDGAYLAKLLTDNKYRVIGLTRSSKNIKIENLEYLQIRNSVEIVECDLTDISSIISLIKYYKPDEVYNLAAQSSVGVSFSQPIGTLNFNISSVLNLLEAIRIVKPDTKFYQASSSEMYGAIKELPVGIDTPMHPLSPYAISKASAFWIVVNYRESYGLFACNGVLFNHESYLRGKDFFVKKVVSAAVKNKDNPDWVLKVGNIEVKRDFGYSPDYVKAMWGMLQTENPEDLIICSGRSIRLRDVIEYVFKKLDIGIEKLVVDPELFRPTDIIDIFGDNREARKKLNWQYDRDFYEVLDLLIEEEQRNSN